MKWLYENFDMSNPLIPMAITGVTLAIGAALLFLFWWVVKHLAIKAVERQINEEMSKPPCDHYFKFADPEIMEHEPHCCKCGKGLIETIDDGE